MDDWTGELECWLALFLDSLGHKARRRMRPAYVAGLIGPGERKSIRPMAAKAEDVGYDRIHHFIAAGTWDSAPLEAELWRRADVLVGGEDSWLVIDDTALPKKGKNSVGVAPQYASALGKNANCQTMVSVTLAPGRSAGDAEPAPVPAEIWTSDPARLERAGVPELHRQPKTKPEIAVEEIDRV